jgi:hypothetical protein
VAELTSPVRAAGTDEEHRMIKYRILAPYLSHKGPRSNRTAIVDPTPAIDDVQISCFVRFRSSFIIGKNGVIENQTKKATKNDHLNDEKVCDHMVSMISRTNNSTPYKFPTYQLQ